MLPHCGREPGTSPTLGSPFPTCWSRPSQALPLHLLLFLVSAAAQSAPFHMFSSHVSCEPVHLFVFHGAWLVLPTLPQRKQQEFEATGHIHSQRAESAGRLCSASFLLCVQSKIPPQLIPHGHARMLNIAHTGVPGGLSPG